VIQRNSSLLASFIAIAALIGCDRTASKPTDSTATGARIVSLSPAATDLLLAMGAEKDIVGVSTFDSDPRVANLPRVGDYENADWERIQAITPSVMIVQMSPDRLPSGFVDRAKKLNITLHSAKIDRFTDIIVESDLIGKAAGHEKGAQAMWKSLRARIDDVQASVASAKPVKTLIVTTADGLGVAGPETYLDDILGFAGGVSALPKERSGYTKIDRELMLTLAPDAIVQLMPGATQAQIDAANDVWKGLPDVPAVKSGRIYTFTQDWVLMPGSHVADLTEMIAAKLHAEAK
jgi:iron complex transport system substrate-binding protein